MKLAVAIVVVLVAASGCVGPAADLVAVDSGGGSASLEGARPDLDAAAQDPPRSERELRPAIVISSDADFTAANGVRGGSGTADDPYVIERWRVVPATGPAVSIRGTSAHVVLRENFLEQAVPSARVWVCSLVCDPHEVAPPSRVGILVERAGNVTLAANVVSGFLRAVWVTDAQGVAIVDNRLVYDDATAEAVSRYREIRDDLGSLPSPPGTPSVVPADPSSELLHVSHAQDLWVEGNVLEGAHVGASLFAATGTFRDNRVSRNGHGFLVDGGSALRFEQNLVRENGRGWYVCGGGTNVTIEQNEITLNRGKDAGEGIFVDENNPYCAPGETWARVAGNTIGSNLVGVRSIAHGSVVENVFAGNEVGVYQQKHAILLEGNTFSESVIGAILRDVVEDGERASLRGNCFRDNGVGAYVLGLEKPSFRENAFAGHAEYALLNTDVLEFASSPAPGEIAVDARHNWWGPSAAPETYGAVQSAPGLSADPGLC